MARFQVLRRHHFRRFDIESVAVGRGYENVRLVIYAYRWFLLYLAVQFIKKETYKFLKEFILLATSDVSLSVGAVDESRKLDTRDADLAGYQLAKQRVE